ncbi:MAG: hypothetical protein COS11_07210 [bacterium (Candidatus Ratteibacteria) CG01_land_8_20_14_3_00_40_19]|uniref:Uncharacterized protein n=2 Tax=Candidatus Ratteibacteria TaxID=2979319 RepID=A0A2M7E715_9BACT|nr:MAG: hypothetical protein AUJ76_03450 [Candidatus Omnitrophica bacterium CG1_02_41_171]PIV63481.1 MAG: hypothetical protein COS11_07210 [bacterium (Candidatus Ratteibacteria) CG01_land_8_20_14_3_00_40_19]PIW33750.1 MAG: hypothetical protein COW28_02905 [bacterium (Candidatus Ratteibacteria) CG15_BIG_FIL_POST_REV_8_21_14_020_41_12]
MSVAISLLNVNETLHLSFLSLLFLLCIIQRIPRINTKRYSPIIFIFYHKIELNSQFCLFIPSFFIAHFSLFWYNIWDNYAKNKYRDLKKI